MLLKGFVCGVCGLYAHTKQRRLGGVVGRCTRSCIRSHPNHDFLVELIQDLHKVSLDSKNLMQHPVSSLT